MSHPNDMTWEELRALVSDMSMMALDLAQHLAFTNDLLKPEYQPEAYRRGEVMAYELSAYPYAAHEPPTNPNVDVAVFGATGLERVEGLDA